MSITITRNNSAKYSCEYLYSRLAEALLALRANTNAIHKKMPFRISAPAISRHLKVLECAGLIARGRDAQWRPCRLEPAAFKEIDAWLQAYRELWEERLDRLDGYLKTLQAKERKHGRRK